jgi:flagellar biosynthetic protein FliR
MNGFLDLRPEDLPVLALVLFRVTGVVLVAPVLGSPNVPAPARIFLSILLSLVFFPIVRGQAAPAELGPLALAAAGELGIGLLIGFAASLLFAAVQLGGHLIDQELGILQSNLLDPFSDAPVSVVGQFKLLLATVVYLLLNGHHLLISAVGDSFRAAPLAAAPAHAADAMVVDLFRMAVQIAAPALVTLFLVTIALAFTARAVPEMNLFALSFPVRLGVGLVVVAIGVGLFQAVFESGLTRNLESIGRILGG